MRIFTRLVTVLIVAVGFCDASLAQSSRTKKASPTPSEQQIRERINAGPVGFAGVLREGAPFRFAPKIAGVVKESTEVHVLPIVPGGPTKNANDFLYLKGV